jgi:ABC-type transporter Mla subunit MlaD
MKLFRRLITIYEARTEALEALARSLDNHCRAIAEQRTAVSSIAQSTKFVASVHRDQLTRAGHKHPSEG